MSETKLIYKKMSEVMRDVKAVTKDQKNTAQGFKFRGIDQFVNALYPALTKHSVFMTPFCTHESHELKEVTRGSGKPGVDKHVTIHMGYNFYAEDGSFVTVGPIPAEGLDSGDKATNKALSAALKYALIQTFSIPTEDMAEADLETPEIGVVRTAAKTEVKAPYVKVETTSEVSSVAISNNAGTATVEAPAPAKISTFRKNKPAVAPTATAQSDEWT